MTNSVVPANESGVILAYDEQLNHTSLTTLSHKGDADYKDGITLSFSEKREQKNKILTTRKKQSVNILLLINGLKKREVEL